MEALVHAEVQDDHVARERTVPPHRRVDGACSCMSARHSPGSCQPARANDANPSVVRSRGGLIHHVESTRLHALDRYGSGVVVARHTPGLPQVRSSAQLRRDASQRTTSAPWAC